MLSAIPEECSEMLKSGLVKQSQTGFRTTEFTYFLQ
jgi:hypothetical protein